MENALSSFPAGQSFLTALKRVKQSVKGLFIPPLIWEEMGFTYMGPVDGHNIEALRETLTLAKAVNQPVLVNVITTKGKGYRPAELDVIAFHGVAPNGSSTSSRP
ncbi:MAG: hypothetical protein M1358_05630 [Chloroflexi bacterium]|nr:hypothetical protein [Chloroflexota bacterium]